MRACRRDRAIAGAIRCYPLLWKSRHRDEAMLLAAALLDDGIPWWSIAWSFLRGAAREQLLRRPILRVRTSVAAFTVVAGVLSLGMFASLATAGAASTNVVIVVSHPNAAARQLEAAFADHHFAITVTQEAALPRLVGSILSIKSDASPTPGAHAILELRGRCVDGSAGCVVGLVVPVRYSGSAQVTIGRATSPS